MHQNDAPPLCVWTDYMYNVYKYLKNTKECMRVKKKTNKIMTTLESNPVKLGWSALHQQCLQKRAILTIFLVLSISLRFLCVYVTVSISKWVPWDNEWWDFRTSKHIACLRERETDFMSSVKGYYLCCYSPMKYTDLSLLVYYGKQF